MAAGQSIIPPFPSDIDRTGFGHHLSGFVGGEGCFQLTIQTHRRPRGEGFWTTYRATLAIAVRADEVDFLRLAQSFWQCGRICYAKARQQSHAYTNKSVRLAVQSSRDAVQVIIPHFTDFPLWEKKRRDYAIWREAAELAHEVSMRPALGKPKFCPRWRRSDVIRFTPLHDALKEVRSYENRHVDGKVLPETVSHGVLTQQVLF